MIINNNKILAGPFYGEFGWEIFGWQGIIRKIIKENNIKEIIIGTRKDRRFLYQDYCTNFIDITHIKDDSSAYQNNDKIIKFGNDVLERYPDHFYLSVSDELYLEYQDTQEFISYGNKIEGYDIIIHSRNREHLNQRNWSEGKWRNLIKELKDFKIACIGTKEHSSIPCDSIKDLRGTDMNYLCDILKSSKLFVSPSSGPAHLASLCKCPHLVWAHKDRICQVLENKEINTRDRYEWKWNPFNTKSMVIDDYEWDPPVEIVRDRIVEFLQFL